MPALGICYRLIKHLQTLNLSLPKYLGIHHPLYISLLALTLVWVLKKINLNKIMKFTKHTNRLEEAKAIMLSHDNLRKSEVTVLSGGWGSGKTTFYQHALSKCLKNQFYTYKFIYISCFGLKDANDLITQILNKTSKIELFGIFSRYFKQILQNSTHFIRDLIPKKLFIIIDDFERLNTNDANFSEVMGLIDYLKNKKNCRFLIITDLNRICFQTSQTDNHTLINLFTKVVGIVIPLAPNYKIIFQKIDSKFSQISNLFLDIYSTDNSLLLLEKAIENIELLYKNFDLYIHRFWSKTIGNINILEIVWKRYWMKQVFITLYLKGNFYTSDELLSAKSMSNFSVENQCSPSITDRVHRITILFNLISDKFNCGSDINPSLNAYEILPLWLSKYYRTGILDEKFSSGYDGMLDQAKKIVIDINYIELEFIRIFTENVDQSIFQDELIKLAQILKEIIYFYIQQHNVNGYIKFIENIYLFLMLEQFIFKIELSIDDLHKDICYKFRGRSALIDVDKIITDYSISNQDLIRSFLKSNSKYGDYETIILTATAKMHLYSAVQE